MSWRSTLALSTLFLATPVQAELCKGLYRGSVAFYEETPSHSAVATRVPKEPILYMIDSDKDGSILSPEDRIGLRDHTRSELSRDTLEGVKPEDARIHFEINPMSKPLEFAKATATLCSKGSDPRSCSSSTYEIGTSEDDKIRILFDFNRYFESLMDIKCE